MPYSEQVNVLLVSSATENFGVDFPHSGGKSSRVEGYVETDRTVRYWLANMGRLVSGFSGSDGKLEQKTCAKTAIKSPKFHHGRRSEDGPEIQRTAGLYKSILFDIFSQLTTRNRVQQRRERHSGERNNN